MSVKKVGQDGEYHHFFFKKNFNPLFFVKQKYCDF